MGSKIAAVDESWYEKPAGVPEHISAGGVVVRQTDDRLYVALVRDGRDRAYVLPKGHVEPGETIAQAACREIEEEAGLTELDCLTELGARSRLNYSKRAWKVTHYFLYATTQVDGSPTDPHKPYELSWFPIDQLPALFWPEQRELVEQAQAWLATRPER